MRHLMKIEQWMQILSSLEDLWTVASTVDTVCLPKDNAKPHSHAFRKGTPIVNLNSLILPIQVRAIMGFLCFKK